MLSLDETIEKLAGGMLGTMSSCGFVQPFVGLVSEGDEIWGDVYQPKNATTTDEFMSAARGRCEDLVREGAVMVVVGICVTLFNTGNPEANRKFGLGGPGDGSLYRNLQASFSMTGKEAHKGIVVMAANRRDAMARLFVPRRAGSSGVEIDLLPKQRMEEATKKLFTSLPWPAVH